MTTVAPVTTVAPATTVASNGVSAVASIAGDQTYYGEHIITLTNTGTITSLSITITVQRTTGLARQSEYTTFWGGTVGAAHNVSPGSVVWTFTNVSGQTIVPGTWKIDAQTSGTGTVHITAGDTWSVTSTSGGITTTRSGTF